MEIKPQILTAKVMHHRLFPKVNRFTYSIYYLALPLPLQQWRFRGALAMNRCGIISLHERDYGARDGSPLLPWVQQILTEYGLRESVQEVLFITMPRLLGYGFNPVSFFLCCDAQGQLRALISEVHNTFGESHSYLAAHADHRPIQADDWLEAEKLFHVSPFIKREGNYRFRIACPEAGAKAFGIFIDYLHPDGQLLLQTALTGRLSPLSSARLWQYFFSHPLVTLKTITLIHWQALKLLRKGIRYLVKPPQQQTRMSATRNLTKM